MTTKDNGPLLDKYSEAIIKGLSKDAEMETNEKGAIQSKSHYAMHLIDPFFLQSIANEDCVLTSIASFMISEDRKYLRIAIEMICDSVPMSKEQMLLKIAEVRHYGTYERHYPQFNWVNIPQESHLNHAMVHWLAYKTGDTQDDHIGHCLCRLMFACATYPTKGFTYTFFEDTKENNNGN